MANHDVRAWANHGSPARQVPAHLVLTDAAAQRHSNNEKLNRVPASPRAQIIYLDPRNWAAERPLPPSLKPV